MSHFVKMSYGNLSFSIQIFLDNNPDIKKLQSHFSSYKCRPLENKEDTRSLSNARIPVINSQETHVKDNDNNNLGCASAGNFYEWLGSIHCDIDW